MEKENQNQTDTEFSDDQLRDLANELDVTGEVEIPSAETTEEERAASESEKQNGVTDPEKEKEPETEAGTPKPGDETSSEKKPEGEQEPSKSKYAKERERQDRSWQAINERKAELEKREAELAEREKSIEAKRSEVEKPTESKDERGYTASDYERAAEQFREHGDADLALRASNRAKELREKDQKASAEGQQKKFLGAWYGHQNEILEKRPELKDVNSELGQAVTKLLKEDRIYSNIPDGFKRAVRDAENASKAELVPSLEKKVAELQEEITRLNSKLQPGGSGPTSQPKQKSFDELSPEEQESQLRKMAEEADRHGEPMEFGQI